MGTIRINQLPIASTITPDDIFIVMDDPVNGGITKQVTFGEFIDAIGVISANTGDITFDGSTISTANTDQSMTITTNGDGDIYIGADRNMIFDMNAFSAKGILLQDSQEDGYDDTETPSILRVGSIYHETGRMVIESDGRIEQLGSGGLNQAYGGLWITNGDNTGLDVPAPIGSELAGNISIRNKGSEWVFRNDTIDLHNGGTQTAQILQFNDSNLQSVITGPAPSADANAQRLIIQGQRGQGNGEGGDVYIWGGDADTNGGDIKIYAGDSDNEEAGYGGYVNIDGGNGYSGGGNVSLSAGNSTNDGGNVYISAGYGEVNRGVVNISTGGGYKQWTFNNDGAIAFPNGTTVAVGTYDNSTGGNNGISLNCYVGYELNWQGGHLKSTYDNGSSVADLYIDSPLVLSLSNAPTSDPMVAGKIWIDTANGNVLKVSAGAP